MSALDNLGVGVEPVGEAGFQLRRELSSTCGSQQALSLGRPDPKKGSRGSWGLGCGRKRKQVVPFLCSHH